MLGKPEFPEIDQRTMKLIVGVIALSLPPLTNYFASVIEDSPLASISESYWVGGWAQSIFVGFLFAIASFLIAYNGESRPEMVLSKVAAGAALCVALFPCACGGEVEIISGLHYVAAGIMFGVLTYFCFLFLVRAKNKGHAQAKARAVLYAICGVTILCCIAALAYNALTDESLSQRFESFVFWGETGGLLSFGISWLTASHVLPLINSQAERFRPFGRGAAPSS
jgi:hypothetical protein